MSVMKKSEKSPKSLPIEGHVVAKNKGDDIFGYMAGIVQIIGDIVGPITPLEDWNTGTADSSPALAPIRNDIIMSKNTRAI
jgi:hypothetical protein